MPRPDDTVRLEHLIEAAEKAVAYAADRDRSALDTDELLRLGLTKLVEIVGEAAKQISEPTRKAHPEVPWAAAARMRDRLVHHYFDINLDILWTTVTVDLPALLKAALQSQSLPSDEPHASNDREPQPPNPREDPSLQ